jgi:hypothetical protein
MTHIGLPPAGEPQNRADHGVCRSGALSEGPNSAVILHGSTEWVISRIGPWTEKMDRREASFQAL